jgi:hypothetical protein
VPFRRSEILYAPKLISIQNEFPNGKMGSKPSKNEQIKNLQRALFQRGLECEYWKGKYEFAQNHRENLEKQFNVLPPEISYMESRFASLEIYQGTVKNGLKVLKNVI